MRFDTAHRPRAKVIADVRDLPYFFDLINAPEFGPACEQRHLWGYFERPGHSSNQRT
jgi:hypothetical protein